MRIRTRELVVLAMMGALAYLAVLFCRIPVLPSLPFLKYEPKDVILVIGGFIFGPLQALAVAAVVALLEMVTISETGIIGLVMNILSSAAFACTAAVIYKHRRNLSGAVIGLAAGCIAMTAVMLLWNYLITPIYMGIPRAAVAAMLIPGFLPFNLIKSILNAAVAMILYKPVSSALRFSGLLTAPVQASPAKRGLNIGVVIVSAVVIVSIVMAILVLQGKF